MANLKSIKSVLRLKVLILLLFSLQPAFSQNNDALIPLKDQKPLEVNVTVHINKIYSINTVSESYKIDGYLVLTWVDERLKVVQKTPTGTLIYENEKTRDLIKNEIWFPNFELINIQGIRETHNISLEINSEGLVSYNERFSGTFSSDMNYRKFPFDIQHFKVMVEAFTYDNRYLVLSSPQMYPRIEESNHLFDKWDILNMSTRIENVNYEELQNIYKEDTHFSRATFDIEAKRLSGYFVWQVLFPIFIIIMASFVVFWITDFSNQIGIGFTLMLTVVAFNFYSVTILPKLPYNTFIEFIIIVGYIFILLSIIAVITNNLINKDKKKLEQINLLKLFRILFPVSYIITMLVLSYLFFA